MILRSSCPRNRNAGITGVYITTLSFIHPFSRHKRNQLQLDTSIPSTARLLSTEIQSLPRPLLTSIKALPTRSQSHMVAHRKHSHPAITEQSLWRQSLAKTVHTCMHSVTLPQSPSLSLSFLPKGHSKDAHAVLTQNHRHRTLLYTHSTAIQGHLTHRDKHR